MAGSTGPDWGAPGRVDEYYFALVDPVTLAEVGQAEVEEGSSSLSWALDSDTILQGTLKLADGDYRQQGYDRMVRVHHRVTVGGESVDHTMCTLFVSSVGTSSVFGRSSRSLSCYGPLWRYTQDVLARDFVRHAGDNVVDCIRDIVQWDGGVLTVGDGVDTSRVHSMDVFFPVGTNRAEVLRAYAGWIGCEIASGDDGSIVLRGYVPPQEKAPVYTFEAGSRCVYESGIEWETNRDEPINRVVAYFSRESKQDDDHLPLSDSVYVDVPDANDFSFARCGRRRTAVLKVSEPCSHDALTEQAQRYLDSSSASLTYITVSHAGIPTLHVGDVVRYVNERDFERPVDVRCQIAQMSVQSLGPLCMTQSKLRLIDAYQT